MAFEYADTSSVFKLLTFLKLFYLNCSSLYKLHLEIVSYSRTKKIILYSLLEVQCVVRLLQIVVLRLLCFSSINSVKTYVGQWAKQSPNPWKHKKVCAVYTTSGQANCVCTRKCHKQEKH